MQGDKAIIFSAPSGSGKTTIVKMLVQQNPDLDFSISACTRDRRGRQEENGKDYYFLAPEDFKSKIDNQEFVEWQEVYAGNFYGTLKSEIERVWASGKNVVFDVDVKGGLNLKKYFGESALAIFVKVPSIEVLAQRLLSRGTESEDSISRRLFKAKFELTFEDQFDVTLRNQNLDESIRIAQQLYRNFAGPPVQDPRV
jgi:guanylate kinase